MNSRKVRNQPYQNIPLASYTGSRPSSRVIEQKRLVMKLKYTKRLETNARQSHCNFHPPTIAKPTPLSYRTVDDDDDNDEHCNGDEKYRAN